MTSDNFERYSRNILIDKIGLDGQKRLLRAKVLIAGAGGLGSTVIANLSSLGIGNLGIIDDDTLELSNLNRQYIHNLSAAGKPKTDSAKAWVENYNKDIKVETFKTRLNRENYRDIIKNYEIIVDCFDSFESKFLLNDIAVLNNIPLIHGGATEFGGQVTVISNARKTPCLRCLFPDGGYGEYILKGVVSPTVSLIASLQSMEVLKLILETGEPLFGKMLVYDGLLSTFKTFNFSKNPNCKICKG